MAELSRKSCPAEKRIIMREHLRYYNHLLVAGIYHFPNPGQSDHIEDKAFYFPALRICINTHLMLAAVVKDATTTDEFYEKVQTVDLHNHVNILQGFHNTRANEDGFIADIIEQLHNDSESAVFNQPNNRPPWRVDILPLNATLRRVFISFTYSHSIGDGMSGAIFHRTFLQAINESCKSDAEAEAQVEIKESKLPVLPRLPVSLTFLLAPALGHYLPSFLSKLLGVKASVSGSDEDTWIGSTFFDNRLSPTQPIRTSVEIFCLDQKKLAGVLESCRRHQTRLTSLLNELIALCVSRKLPRYHARFSEKTNLISCIPTNIRKAAGVSDDILGNIASAAYSRHPITNVDKLNIDEDVWSRARLQSAHLATSVVSLKNQPIGLLGWISNMKAWMEEKMGEQRDSSWQLSNLMAFEGRNNGISVQKVVFSQPADAVGIPLNFNTISTKGGDLVICVSWQAGAVGLDKVDGVDVEMNERKLVSELLEDLKSYLKLAAES